MAVGSGTTAPVIEYQDPLSNVTQVTAVTATPGAMFIMSTAVGINDEQIPQLEAATYLAGTGLTGGATGIETDFLSLGTVATMLDTEWLPVTTAAGDRKITKANLLSTISATYSAVNVLDHGADPTGVADSTAAFIAAVAVGGNVIVPDGTYRITSTITCTLSGQVIFGTGSNLCKIISEITNGSPTFDFTAAHQQIRGIRVNGQIGIAPPYQDCTGVRFNGATRGGITDLAVYYCRTGLELLNSWIGSHHNVLIRWCDLGLNAAALNNTDISLHMENCTQGFVINGASGSRMDYMHEGDPGTYATSQRSSTLDDCRGFAISSCYLEFNSAPSAPEITVGATTNVLGLTVDALTSTRGNSTDPIFALDKADGVHFRSGRQASGGGDGAGLIWTETANTKNVLCGITQTDRVDQIQPAGYAQLTPVNWFPDPYQLDGLPTFAGSNNASASLETTIVPTGAEQAIKVETTGAGTSAYVEVDVQIVGDLRQLRGARLGISSWVYTEDSVSFQGNSPRVEVRAHIDGASSMTDNNRTYVRGAWVQNWNFVDVPTGANTVNVRLYVNRSSDSLPVGSFAVFSGIHLWLGGDYNYSKLLSGWVPKSSQTINAAHAIKMNATASTAAAVDITQGDLPAGTVASGSTVLGWDSTDGSLREFDVAAMSGGVSRKEGQDTLATTSGVLAIDFDAGTYDNKIQPIDGDITNVVFAATRPGNYEVWFQQTGGGGFDVDFLITPLQPAGQPQIASTGTTIIRFTFDGTDYHWG